MWKPILLLAVLAGASAPAHSCASIVTNEQDVVQTTDESAIILWDSTRKEEHFIRRASFQTTANDFGFLVPTPTRPELSEVDDLAFGELQGQTLPKVVTQNRWRFSASSMLFGGGIRSTFNTAAGSINTSVGDEVSVLETAKLGNYDVAVLQSRNADSVTRWLKEHGYPSDATLDKWMKPYAEKNWVLTAFKVNRAPDGDLAQLTAFRMSFKTDKPFYPYKEPARDSKRAADARALRVYFLSDARVEGSLENSAKAWPGHETWNDNITPHSAAITAGYLKLDESLVKRLSRMTVFGDFSSPRPGFADVYFSRAEDQEANTPPPIIKWKDRTIWIPAEVMIVLGFGVFFVVVKRANPTS